MRRWTAGFARPLPDPARSGTVSVSDCDDAVVQPASVRRDRVRADYRLLAAPAPRRFRYLRGSPRRIVLDHLLAAITCTPPIRSRDEMRPPTRRMVSPTFGELRSTIRISECRLFFSRTNRLRREERLSTMSGLTVARGAGGTEKRVQGVAPIARPIVVQVRRHAALPQCRKLCSARRECL
jgi:hypothetical protein